MCIQNRTSVTETQKIGLETDLKINTVLGKNDNGKNDVGKNCTDKRGI